MKVMGMTGETIGGRWRLMEVLGRSRGVTTYLAWDETLERELEVDAVETASLPSSAMAQRLEEILDSCSQVRSPHAVRLYGWERSDGGDILYLMMERVEGISLTALLEDTRELPGEQVVEIAGAVADVLAESYGRDIYYLGLNPDQLVVDRRGEVRIARVGYGWILEEMDPLRSARVSPFRAPETDGGKEGSRASDVYALAAMLREMLPPGEVSPRLDSLLARALDPLATRRPSSPRLLVEELDASRPGDAGHGIQPGTGPQADPLEGQAGGLSFLKDNPRSSRAIDLSAHPGRRLLRSLLLVIAGGLMLWLGFAAVTGSLSGDDGDTEAAGPPSAVESIEVPDLQGLEAEEAEEALAELGLKCVRREAPSSLWSAGRVAAQEPEEGTPVERGKTVYLVISTGREPAPGVPDRDEAETPAAEPEPALEIEGSSSGTGPDRGGIQDASAAEPPPAPPKALPALSVRCGPAPLYVNMDGSSSYDPDGRIRRYVWSCGDGTVLEGAVVQHVFDPAVIPARYQVVLQVYDDDGLSGAAAVTVEVY